MSHQTRRRHLSLLATALVAAAVLPTLASAGETVLPTETAASQAPAHPKLGDPEFVNYLLDRIDDISRGESSHALLQMKVKTKHYTRAMALESWSMGEKFSLVRILEPKKERGTATLKAHEDLFSYLSKTGRTVKITGAMMGGAWMGSHFTNDDLVKSTRLRDEFNTTVSEGPTVEGGETYKLVLIPKPHTVVVWGQIDIVVRKSDLLPVGQLFYDEDGEPVRKMDFREYRKIGERSTATRITMTPLDKPNEYTEIRYAKMEFDVGLDKNFFTLQRLKSM